MKFYAHFLKATGITLLFLAPVLAYAQGTQADYERAARFLSPNIQRLVYSADIRPQWVKDSQRFWYRKPGPDKEFLLVDAAKNTRAPAFDHAKLAAALSRSAGKEYQPNKLPFESFEFAEKGGAIRFEAEGQRWTCDLATYKCEKEALPPSGEGLSPGRQVGCFCTRLQSVCAQHFHGDSGAVDPRRREIPGLRDPSPLLATDGPARNRSSAAARRGLLVTGFK